MKVVNAGTWKVTVGFDDGLKLCEKLKLVEFMQHGDATYTRFTQKGINVLATLTELMHQHAEAVEDGEVLRGS
jgi:hypothetical protein